MYISKGQNWGTENNNNLKTRVDTVAFLEEI